MISYFKKCGRLKLSENQMSCNMMTDTKAAWNLIYFGSHKEISSISLSYQNRIRKRGGFTSRLISLINILFLFTE